MSIPDAPRGFPDNRWRTKDAGPCDVCGGPTFEARCKLICRRCGYTRDCSDP